MILPTRLDEAIVSFTRLVDQRWRSGHAVHGIPSGWADFDRLTGGLPAPGYTAVTCAPDVPLGPVLASLATNIAIRQHENLIVVAPAMTHDSLVGRLLAAESGVAHRILESGRLTQKHWARVERASNRLCKAPVHILAGRPISPEVLGMSIAAIRRQVTQRQVVLIHATGPQTADARHVGAPYRKLAVQGLAVVMFARSPVTGWLEPLDGVDLSVTMQRGNGGTIDVAAYDAIGERIGGCALAFDALRTRLAPVAWEVNE